MKNRGEHWTETEIKKLKVLYSKGIKVSDISVQLERSESAISKKIKELYGANRRSDWTDEEITKLKELHEEGLAYQQIAVELGKTARACQSKAVRIGIKTKDRNVWKDKKRADFWTDTDVERLKELADKGFSASEIAEKIGRSKKSVFYKMGSLDIHIKEKSDLEESNYRRVYSVDDDYFAEIDTQKKAYFLGWIVTDGYVSSVLHSKRGDIKSNRIALKLEISDLDVIQEFQRELKTNTPIKYHKARTSREYENKHTGRKFIVNSHEQCSLEVTSAKMKSDLERYGIVPHKTYIIDFPKNLREEFYPGFIAGVLSGDGCVDIKKNHGGTILRSSICGTEKLLIGIQKILVKNISFNAEKLPRKSTDSEHLYILELSQTETLNLYFWLKENGISIMSRKNKIIEEYLKLKPDLLG